MRLIPCLTPPTLPTVQRRPLTSLSLRAMIVAAVALMAGQKAEAQEHPGAVLYQKYCVECHGKTGEGVAGKYDEPLHGSRSLDALSKRIDRTMPEDNEEVLDAEQSAQVAAYIYDAFYSPAAQAKLSPVEKDLARLTISQYRNSVTDLVGRFRPGFDKPLGDVRGLSARIGGFMKEAPQPEANSENKDKKPEKKEREKFREERIDGRISFHYGTSSPHPDKMAEDEFNNRWEGSVIAEETGVYEFIVKTENGVRLFVNDRKTALIDGWVTPSPNVREERKSIFLVGGRAYPLTLEHFKYKEKSASVELLWKPPHGSEEVIPQRFLSPERLRTLLVLSNPFPADDRSVGYERGTGVSKSWNQATTEAAIDAAEHVDKNLDELAGTKGGAPDRAEKLKQFAQTFVEAGFRRPLTDEQKELHVERHFREAKSPEIAVKRVVLFTLKSPRFLYPELVQTEDKPDGHVIASRLALALWDSIPDRRLAQRAAEGKLNNRNDALDEGRRMLKDPRAKAKLHGFFHHWLELERAEAVSKDPKKFPDFSPEILADLRTSLQLFVDQVVWSEKSDYRELLQADYLWLNQRLAKFYGKGDTGEEFKKVSFNPNERAGVVTHPYLLAAFAYSNQSSPIHRGVFLTRNILGMTLNSPPMAIEFEDSHFDPKMTMREKVTQMTKDTACIGCHSVINPLGFSLENFDAVGRWRTQDNNKAVDTTSEFPTDEGTTLKLTGARDVVQYAAENAAGHRAFIRHLFHHTVKQPVASYGEPTMETLRVGFEKSGFNMQQLLMEIALMAALEDVPPVN